MFLLPKLQPITHSPHSRQVERGRPCRSGAAVVSGTPGAGGASPSAKDTASAGRAQSSPSRAAASRMASVLGVS